MSKIKIFLLAALAAWLTGCALTEDDQTGGRLTITATLFPQYDFARQIAGDKAEVTLLMPPGIESHTYEPTPSDIARLRQSDLLLYTGANMEPWAASLFSDIPSTRIADVSEGIALDAEEHDEAESSRGHFHQYDPHIWTSPLNAKVMAENITAAMCETDPENAEAYRANNAILQQELDDLDEQFRTIVKNAARREVVFGGRYAFHYLIKEYGLTPVAAYDSCSAEAEPSARTVALIIDKIRADSIPVIYYEELSDPKVARAIREETGVEMLLLHSCHNVSRQEFREGVAYVDLMRQNAENLKRGLS